MNNNSQRMTNPNHNKESRELVDHYLPTQEDTQCGVRYLQKLASKKSFILLHSIIGATISAAQAYTTGTLTTMEKRFKIPSKYSGMILTGYHISMMLCSIGVSYFAAKGHRPRWMATGVYLLSIFCFMMVLPHLLYGAGEDAISLSTGHVEEMLESYLNESVPFVKKTNLCEMNRE